MISGEDPVPLTGSRHAAVMFWMAYDLPFVICIHPWSGASGQQLASIVLFSPKWISDVARNNITRFYFCCLNCYVSSTWRLFFAVLHYRDITISRIIVRYWSYGEIMPQQRRHQLPPYFILPDCPHGFCRIRSTGIILNFLRTFED